MALRERGVTPCTTVRAALPLVLVSSMAAAQQFVVTEVTYTHSATTTTDSHYHQLPLPGTPSNWVSPIDYAHGSAVVRLEVFTKPSATPTRFQICFEATPNYACTNQAPAYTTTGVYTWTTPFTSFYQYSLVDWSQGTRNVALILKDTNNVKPAPENVGAQTSALYMPTDLRVTVTIVAPGATYAPPEAGPDAGAIDAGVDAGAPDAGAPDAGELDAGGLDAGADGGPVEELTTDAGAMMNASVRGGCSSAPLAWAALTLLLLARRRSR